MDESDAGAKTTPESVPSGVELGSDSALASPEEPSADVSPGADPDVAPAQSQPTPALPEPTPAPAPFIPPPELLGGPIVEVAMLRFRDDRVEILSTTPRAPIPRVDVMAVRFAEGPNTEEPRRELAWLAITLTVGTLALIGAVQDGGTFAWVIALGCFAVSVPLIRNRFQRVTVLEIETTTDTRRFPLDYLMSPAEIEALANRLRELPNWPIFTNPSSPS